MRKLGLINWIFGKKIDQPQSASKYKMIHDEGEGFYEWGGKLYRSDIVRACIRPKAKSIGKLVAKHIRETEEDFKHNPDPGIKMLLEEPNPLMTGQMFQEKMATQLELNNNAFALIKRDEKGYAYEIYPVPATSIDMVEGEESIYLRFHFVNGQFMTAAYKDIIHLRQDYNKHQIFGDNQQEAITNLMEIVSVIDQGMIKAVKSSAVVRWIMRFNQVLRQEDIDKQVEEFTNNYLSLESKGGAMASDPRYELKQVEPKNYVPDDKQMDRTTERIYRFFNTNKNIVESDYNEDQWNAYYESVIQPVAMQLANEYTRKLFTRRERGHGNMIIFESSALQYASMKTKMSLVHMVDRGALTPNEWRKILNLGPVEDGDKPIRRLDTDFVSEGVNIDDDETKVD